ncbi:MAG: hypothetical protein E7458_09770 [Ruminococcaceae bacterium]|nr:hypothetical protein [Oscillospiraceae bacterium]
MKKKWIWKAMAGFFLLLVLATCVSTSVYHAKLPVVTVMTGMQSTIEHHKTTSGELYTEGETLFVRYRILPDEADRFLTPDLGKVSVKVVQSDANGNETVATETLDAGRYQSVYEDESDMLLVSAELTPPVGRPILDKSAVVTLSDGIYVPYLNVVPAYCIQEDAEGTFVWTLMERENLFGVEQYVLRTSVTVEAENDYYAAFSYMPGTQVVAATTLPLRSGDVVVVS